MGNHFSESIFETIRHQRRTKLSWFPVKRVSQLRSFTSAEANSSGIGRPDVPGDCSPEEGAGLQRAVINAALSINITNNHRLSSSLLVSLAQVPDNDEQFVPDFQTENCE